MDSSPEVVSKEEGLRLLRAGQLDDAIRILEKLADKGSEDPQVYSYLGAAYSKKDDKLLAIRAFEEALRLEETPKAYFNLAVMYETAGRIDEAVREFKMAAELDPAYAPAQEALQRLHDKFAASQPQPPAEPAAAATQVMTAAVPAASQTQAFSGPPPGPAVGQAPMPIADPFARQFGPPPSQTDLMAQQMQKEQEIADQHHKLMKNGLIYGAICGVFLFVAAAAVCGAYLAALGGISLTLFILAAGIGAFHGCLVGLWVGYTCGGEGAGFQAGAALGVLFGVLLGLICLSIYVVIVVGITFGLISGFVGWIIGRLVDMSISD